MALTATGCVGGRYGPDTYVYTDKNGGNQTYTVAYTSMHWKTNFLCGGNPTDVDLPGTFFPTTITETPSGQQYTLTYESTPGYAGDITGRIQQITFPSGGYIKYSYAGGSNGLDCISQVVPQLTKTVYDGNGNTSTWTYVSNRSSSRMDSFSVTETDPAGNQAVYAFFDEFQLEKQVYQGPVSPNNLISTTVTCYNARFSNCPTSSPGVPTTQTDVFTYPKGSSSASLVETKYNITGTVAEIKKYDFGAATTLPPTAAPTASPISDTTFTYDGQGASCGSLAILYMYDRPCSITTLNSSGATVSQTKYTYNSAGHPTQTSTLVSGSTYLTSSASYNANGTVASSTDVNSATTNYFYNGTGGCNNVLLTSTSFPVSSLSTSQTWDCNGGVRTSSTDQNAQVANYGYVNQSGTPDPFWRVLQENFPDGGQTSWTYNSPTSTTTTTKMNSSQNIVSTVLLDGLGRTIQTQLTSDLAGTDYTDTAYDALGRVATVSNPYRTKTDPTYGVTTYTYDSLGRITQVTHPDGATVLATYTGRATQVQDEGTGTNRVTQIFQTDSLGRLVSVCEVSSVTLLGATGTPAACGQDIAATGFLTNYQYDALGNLTQVNQGGLNARTFSYDAMSRLTSETNPESGIVTYGYDAGTNKGDLTSIVAPAPNQTGSATVTTTYSWDLLHRLTQKSYSDGATPKAVFNYDETAPWGWTLSNPLGRLTTTYTKNSSGGTIVSSIFSYDPMGRVAIYEQCQPLNCGPAPSLALTYAYNLLGEPISLHHSQTNVFDFILSYGYNSTAHLATMTSSLNDANHPQTLFSGASYDAPALLTTALLGGIVNEHRSYNSRLWPTSVTVDSSVYSYSMSSYAPNGNILGVNDSVNGNWVYKYDDFNRLGCSNLSSNGTCAAPTNGTATYTYDYDRFGNRWHQNGPQSMQLSFSGNNNRMDTYSYDAAGNLLNDGSHQYFYDAENRLIQVGGTLGNCSTATACYTYDASGQRVSKTSGGVSLAYLYDTAGRVVVETNLNASPATWTRGEIFAAGRHIATYSGGASGTTNFIETDWLGTERVRTNHSGAACETITSLPFGDGQSTSGSCGDPSPMHFTSDQRDSETNLDHTWFRQYSSQFGRWMHPDPAGLAAVDPSNPQSWNRYSYVFGSPLNLTDSAGLFATNSSFDANGDPINFASIDTDRRASCLLDGYPIGCAALHDLLATGSAAICPDNHCTPGVRVVDGPGGTNLWQQWAPWYVYGSALLNPDGSVREGSAGVVWHWATTATDPQIPMNIFQFGVFTQADRLVKAGTIYTAVGVGTVVAAPVVSAIAATQPAVLTGAEKTAVCAIRNTGYAMVATGVESATLDQFNTGFSEAQHEKIMNASLAGGTMVGIGKCILP